MNNLLIKILLITFYLSLTACVGNNRDIVQIPEPLEEIQVAAPAPREAGSLWSANQASYFSDRKANNVGDIVTVIIEEQASASKSAATSTGKSSSMGASAPALLGLEQALAGGAIDLSNLLSTQMDTDFQGTGSTTRSGNLTASLTTQVVAQYPNGQLKIRGGKEVMVNSEVQIIYLTGIIRPVDITAANTVNSTKVLNARISYTGKGAIDDTQSPGWFMRGVNNVWPF